MLLEKYLKEKGLAKQQINAVLVAGALMNLLPVFVDSISSEWKKAKFKYTYNNIVSNMWETCNKCSDPISRLLLKEELYTPFSDGLASGFLYQITHGFLDGVIRFMVENGLPENQAESMAYDLAEHILYSLIWDSKKTLMKSPLLKDVAPELTDMVTRYYTDTYLYMLSGDAYSLAAYGLSNGKDQEVMADVIHFVAEKALSTLD
ncbi:MAG: hypothetical protein IKI86_00725 [Firmicutes bacterium]|nr:hypothetical protein [Bacillota bacterium]